MKNIIEYLAHSRRKIIDNIKYYSDPMAIP